MNGYVELPAYDFDRSGSARWLSLHGTPARSHGYDSLQHYVTTQKITRPPVTLGAMLGPGIMA